MVLWKLNSEVVLSTIAGSTLTAKGHVVLVTLIGIPSSSQ